MANWNPAPNRIEVRAGDRYGLLVIVSEAKPTSRRMMLVRCDCGNEQTVTLGSLRSGNTSSCGCQMGARTHGRYKTPEYRAWLAMIQRCTNPKTKFFEYYGGRGITVCAEWRESFEAFFGHIGPRPSTGHSLDRFPNNDGNYEPGNVRWATRMEQAHNRRPAKVRR